MTDILDRPLAPSDEAVVSRLGEETVLLHLGSGTYYGLDAMGTRIWESLKEGLAARAICAAIAGDHGVELETVEEDARAFLKDLEDHEILVGG